MLESGWGDQVHAPVLPDKAVAATGSAHGAGTPAADATATGSYLPDQFAMQTPALAFANRVFESLVVGGAREGRLWKLSLTVR